MVICCLLQNSCQTTQKDRSRLHAGPKMALGSLFLADEVLVAHLSEAAHQSDKLAEVNTVVLVSVQVIEDAVQCCLVIGFLQVRKQNIHINDSTL